MYATDASNYRQTPIGVVFPRTTEEVVETIKICHRFDTAILPRGAGTSLAGQCCNAAVVVDLSRHLRRIVDIDADHKTARVQAGVVLDDLQRAVGPHRLMYGPDPATHAWCTFGGMIGNNSCGVHSVIAGTTADAVEALEIVTSDGVRLNVGRTSPDALSARCAETGRVGEIHRGLRTLSDRYRSEVIARYPAIPRRVSGFNLDALLPERGFDLGGNMKRALTAAALGPLLVAALAAAQGSGQPQNPPTTPNPAATTPQATTTITGCLYREDQIPGRRPNVAERAGVLEDYILAEASTPATERKPGEVAGTAGTAGTSPASGAMYKVEGPSDEKLKALVGKRVEVTGRIDPEGVPGGAPGTAAKDRGLGPDQINLPEFEAASIREISGTCPATPAPRK